MFAPFPHSVFEPDVKIEPLNFYGCESLPENPPEIENDRELLLHKRIVHREEKMKPKSKSQVCKICGKILSSTSSYYVHMKSHSGNKPYQCTQCDAAFCRKPYLEVHMRTHTGERPFQCDVCAKRFTQKSSLNTHKRVHSGERPFECDICGKSFAVKSYLVSHRWSHISDTSLFCGICQLNLSNKNLFIQHMKKHNNKVIDCPICNRSFLKQTFLIRHQNKVHKINSTRNGGSNNNDVTIKIEN